MSTKSEDDDSAKELIGEVEKIIEGAAESHSIEAVFTIAAKVTGWLVACRKALVEGNFTDAFAEDVCMILFQKFFPAPPNGWNFSTYQTQDEDE